MNDFDISLWRKRLKAEYQEREDSRRKTLAKTVPKLKRYFKGKKMSQVYLTGSILQSGKFYDFSDIDVALETSPKNPFRMMAELEKELHRPVDLLFLNECRFRDRLIKCGKRIL